MIRVVNKRNYVHVEGIAIPIDRSSVLGNPFRMYNEEQRNLVCDNYANWLDNQIAKKNEKVCNELNKIYKYAASGVDVYLMCWCAPKRCHGDYIKQVIENKLKKRGFSC